MICCVTDIVICHSHIYWLLLIWVHKKGADALLFLHLCCSCIFHEVWSPWPYAAGMPHLNCCARVKVFDWGGGQMDKEQVRQCLTFETDANQTSPSSLHYLISSHLTNSLILTRTSKRSQRRASSSCRSRERSETGVASSQTALLSWTSVPWPQRSPPEAQSLIFCNLLCVGGFLMTRGS